MAKLINTLACALLVIFISCKNTYSADFLVGSENVKKFWNLPRQVPQFEQHVLQYYKLLGDGLNRIIPQLFNHLDVLPKDEQQHFIKLYLSLYDKENELIQLFMEATASVKPKIKKTLAIYALIPLQVSSSSLNYYILKHGYKFKGETAYKTNNSEESDLIPLLEEDPFYKETMSKIRKRKDLSYDAVDKFIHRYWILLDMVFTNMDEAQRTIGDQYDITKIIIDVCVYIAKKWDLMKSIPESKYTYVINAFVRLPLLAAKLILGEPMLEELIHM